MDGGVLRLAGGVSLAMADYIIVFDFPDRDEPMYEHEDGLVGGVMLTPILAQAARFSEDGALGVLASHPEAIRQFGAVAEMEVQSETRAG